MPTPQREPLRRLSRAEQAALQRIAKSSSERVDHVRRATALLAVARGAAFIQAARQAGLRSGTTVADLVARFNRHGVLVGHLVLARVDRERQAQVVAIPLDAREMHPAVIFELAGIDGRQELRERPTGLLPVHPPHCTTESLPQWCTNSSQVNDVSKIAMSSDDGYQIHAKRWARSWKARRSASPRPGSQLT